MHFIPDLHIHRSAYAGAQYHWRHVHKKSAIFLQKDYQDMQSWNRCHNTQEHGCPISQVPHTHPRNQHGVANPLYCAPAKIIISANVFFSLDFTLDNSPTIAHIKKGYSTAVKVSLISIMDPTPLS